MASPNLYRSSASEEDTSAHRPSGRDAIALLVRRGVLLVQRRTVESMVADIFVLRQALQCGEVLLVQRHGGAAGICYGSLVWVRGLFTDRVIRKQEPRIRRQ